MGAKTHLTLDSLAWDPFGEGEFQGVLDNAIQKLEKDQSFYTLEFVKDDGLGNDNSSIIYFINVSESECVIHAMYFGEQSGTRNISAPLKLPAQRLDDALEMLVGIGIGKKPMTYVHTPHRRTTRHLVDTLRDYLSGNVTQIYDHAHNELTSTRAYHLPEMRDSP
jgi:hypothetical protein